VIRSTLALLLLVTAGTALAQDAEAWLGRMADALQQVDYRGVLVYSHGAQLHGVQVFRAAGPDGARERLVALDGAERDVIRHGGRQLCRSGSDGDFGQLASGPGPALVLKLPLEHYRLQMDGQDRVAGHAVQVVTIEPRDAFRFGHRLWLERESGLPLRSLMFGSDARVAAQSFFAQIELGYLPTAEELGRCDELPPAPAAARSAEPATSHWRIEDLPPGFSLLRVLTGVAGGESEQQIYGDGLAMVSVYIERRAMVAEPLSGPAQRGALSLFGRSLGGHHITVVGEVPAITVQRMAQGMVDGRVPGG